MYARVAKFEERDPSLTDKLIERAREQGPATVPGAKGFLGLLDRERGTSVSITFFDSEEAIRDSEPAFEEMARQFPEDMRGQRKSLDAYEVVLVDGDAENAKAARISSLEGSPESIDDNVDKIKAETAPRVRELDGSVGMIGLADRTSGRVISVTLWASEDALRQSEEQADRLRAQAAESAGQQIGSVDRYAVGIAQQLTGVRA
jgi:heme-degrading monooxygenase HmoA